ncbi:MAG: molecular chaperone DnaJ [Planctomycetia bacterium]|nr:molecular chaperone DnaJ [Planctomycetia bacterium]
MNIFKPGPDNLCASVLTWLFDGYWPTAGQPETGPVVVPGPTQRYTLQRMLAVGDVADIHLATVEDEPTAQYLLKVARVAEGRALLDVEQQTLMQLLAAAGDTTYRQYLPELIESFPVRDRIPKRVNVFRAQPGFRTLEQVHEQLPALDGRHLGWIFNRLLTVLGFIRRQGWVHGAVLPCHVLIHPEQHGLQLVGWGQGVPEGQRIRSLSARYRTWYPPEVFAKQAAGPATDLYLAARCIVYLAGGDPATDWLPDAVPPPLQRFLRTCLLPGPRMRPDDAWDVLEDFNDVLRSLYGPPKFHALQLR